MTTRTILATLLCATVLLAGCAGFGIGGGDGTATPTPTPTDTTTTTTEEPTTTETTVTATESTTTEVPTTTEDGTTTTEPTPTADETTTVETTEEPPTTRASDTTTAMTTTSVASPRGTSAVGSGAFQFLAFEQPGTYTYEVTFVPTVSEQQGTQAAVTRQGQNQSAEYVIDVVQASENQYEVQVSLSMTGGMSNQQTFTGTRQEVQQQMLGSQVGAFLAPLTTMTGFYGGRSLEVGQSWSYSSQEGMVGFEVTGSDAYAGVDCFVSEASVNGTVVHEACVSPDRGLAPYAAYYNESGTLTFEMELTSYEPG